jgi:hypothetical protein
LHDGAINYKTREKNDFGSLYFCLGEFVIRKGVLASGGFEK